MFIAEVGRCWRTDYVECRFRYQDWTSVKRRDWPTSEVALADLWTVPWRRCIRAHLRL